MNKKTTRWVTTSSSKGAWWTLPILNIDFIISWFGSKSYADYGKNWSLGHGYSTVVCAGCYKPSIVLFKTSYWKE